MRNTRERWTFYNHPSKPVISLLDLKYWKGALKKILKVGMEFEFNLPDKTGTCKGNNNSCPCSKMAVDECWKECMHIGACKDTPNKQVCSNVGQKCGADGCASCKEFAFMCHGAGCTDFMSRCFSCEAFEINCNKCKHRFDPTQNPDHIRSTVAKELAPSNTYGVINKSGVHSITTDGSLLGKKGMEVITIGRRVDYWEFLQMARRIIHSAKEKGAYINERCSIHMHLLASYYSKIMNSPHDIDAACIPSKISELERDVPEIILANFHQLCRRYQNAITWMTMGLDDPDHMTRWEKFRVSVLDVSAVHVTMEQLKSKVAENSGGNKYGWVNYNYMDFNEQGDISRLHLEMRVMDGMMVPSAVAAVACMYHALMIKAVEISRYGLLEVGNKEWMEQARTVKAALLNNMKGYQDGDRFGDTRKLHNYYNVLIGESLDLVRQLKHILMSTGPAYQVLEKLAEKPVALRRCDGYNWDEIEATLQVPPVEDGMFDRVIGEYIDLRLVSECKDVDEWVSEIMLAISESLPAENLKETIHKYVEDKRNDGELIWSDTLGSVVRV